MKPETVLLLENIHPDYMRRLAGKTRVVRPASLDEKSLVALAAKEQAAAIIVRSKGRITEQVIGASPKLRIIGRHGIGVEHIDLAAASRAEVWVVNTPGASRIAVAEQTWSMLLALAKNTLAADRAVRSGDFGYREREKAIQLHGKTLGVIGLGRIGASVAEIAVRGFGMNVLYCDIVKYPTKEKRLRCVKVSLRKLLQSSDMVTLHTPLDESTRGLIGPRELAMLQPHALLINCARGAIVDTFALARALEERKLGGAAIDVFDPEEPPPDHPLLKSDRVLLSPHYAAQTPEANKGYGEVIEDVFRVLKGKRPRYPVNEVGAPAFRRH